MIADDKAALLIVRAAADALALGYTEGVKAERTRVESILDYQAWLEQSGPGMRTIGDISEKVKGGE